MPPYLKKYRPGPYLPSTSFTGDESPLLLKGENMWVRYSRNGSAYAEGYTGSSQFTDPAISTKTLSGTLAWTSGSKTITGTSTAFLTELRLGSYVLGDGGAGATQLFVVEKIVSNTSFECSKAPDATSSGKTGYVLPVIFAVGNDRGTAIRGNVLRYPRGHYIGVGDGTFALNGQTTLGTSGTLTLSKTPQFALYDPSTNTYTQNDVGIDQPITPITLAAGGAADTTVTNATNASPIVITTASAHRLYTGQQINITGVTGNTAANGNFTVTVLTSTTFSLDGSTGNGAYVAGGTINGKVSQMRAGSYGIRICNANTSTLGFSQPSDAIAPVTLTAGQWIVITFNTAMLSDQDAYDVYGTQFADNSTSTIEARYMGPWYKVLTVTKDMLKTTATPLGTESGTSISICYSDAEIQNSQQILTFNNFAPVDAEFVDTINGFPIYFSCLGRDLSTTKKTSPGPAAVPSKPSNPEAVFLDKTITTAGSDYIVGEFNAKSRIFVLCQTTLQTLILTTIDDEPVTFRSLWNSGFRNPYNVAFVKEYLYGFSTQKVVRSVAGGDDTTVEFEFANDVRDLVKDWPCGHMLVGYCPKNRAVVYFYSAYERRSGYWVTYALPFMIDQGVWNPPIVLSKSNTDFIVSGVATVGEQLCFVAGGRTSGGSISVNTYAFDGGDSETKNWYLAWAYSSDQSDLVGKTIKGLTFTGRLNHSTNSILKIYGLTRTSGVEAFDFTSLAAGTNAQASYVIGDTGGWIARKRLKFGDWGPHALYTARIEGTYTTTADRVDQLALDVEVNAAVN